MECRASLVVILNGVAKNQDRIVLQVLNPEFLNAALRITCQFDLPIEIQTGVGDLDDPRISLVASAELPAGELALFHRERLDASSPVRQSPIGPAACLLPSFTAF